ncbi:hypothetical protein BGI41_02280 [Methanobrevibacter sp. 87.7]|uniref:DUF4013 domain-containing protein n=1 Tax=Methanobrevibacter sp. 87.7 TaxID=387957 RepID=UPI000B502474|nr:DUF4013 domain-containing protein [Methanobrevibacter sp. 87.7]OWT33463.1 hypothetical protein BGI41_02280 [Methanobrevibacter sp. 87.7]
MILDIYKDSLEYGVKDVKNLVIMGVMGLLGFLIIPTIMLEGYSYRVIQRATHGMINGDEPLPDFSNWKKLFVDGIKLIVVKIVYNIIPIVLTILAFVYNFNIIIAAVITFIIFDMLSMVAVAHMSVNDDSLRSAFDFEEVFDIFKSIGVLRYFGFYLGLIVLNCVIVAIFLVVLLILLGICLGISSLGGMFNPGNALALSIFVILLLAFSFIVQPYIIMINSRATGLVYNIR